jgi:hypothetical protein
VTSWLARRSSHSSRYSPSNRSEADSGTTGSWVTGPTILSTPGSIRESGLPGLWMTATAAWAARPGPARLHGHAGRLDEDWQLHTGPEQHPVEWHETERELRGSAPAPPSIGCLTPPCRQVAGDRLFRDRDGAAIDVLLPSFRSRPRTNVKVGPVTATEAGGLTYALGHAPQAVSVTAALTDGRQLPSFVVHLPHVDGALAVKAHAWHHRRAARDALDIWRLLHIADLHGLRPDHWRNSPTLERAGEILRTDFRMATSAGTVLATTAPRERAILASLSMRVVG